ncbi:hypothetical protein ACWDV4_26465 [Micromonospora sp. NPDC003197]
MTVPPQQPPPTSGGWPQQPPTPQAWPQQPANPQAWPQQSGGPAQPQQQAWPQQPAGPGGWQQPPVAPAPLVKRIPEDQPFVVRPSGRKYLLFFGGLMAFVLLMAGCPLGLMAMAGSPEMVLIGLGIFLVTFGGLFGLQYWMVASGGPVLAVGPTGLWIKTRPTRGQAVWLPWEAVEQVYRRRWAFNKYVCVKLRDPRMLGNLGAYTALDSSMMQGVFGTGLTATLNFGDRPEAEIMQAIGYFSAGRCPVS